MSANKDKTDSLSEKESLQVIQEMILVSKNKMKRDVILFIVWGWILFVNNFFLSYMTGILEIPQGIMGIIRTLRILLPLLGFIFTVYYIFMQRKKVQTYIGVSLRYVWISLVVGLMLINMIQFNVLNGINFELQHPVYMVFMAFAITVTGGILRFEIIIFGGIIFAALAYVASHLGLQEQLLIESVAWLIAFIIPGHILYAKRKRTINV